MSQTVRNYPGAIGEDLESLGRPDRALRAEVAALQAVVTALQQGTETQQPSTLPVGIDNLLKASDFDHSVLSYTGAGAAGELFGWKRGVNAASTILDVGTNPLWDKAQGWLRWSSVLPMDDLSYNFSKRLIRPGQVLYLMLNARLRAAANAAGLQLEAGIWDRTPGIDTWVTASLVGGASGLNITVTKVGPGAPVTNYTYRVVANTDRGQVLVSGPGTVVGAAALNAVDYNQVAWAAVSGALQYRVYRTTPNPGLLAVLATGTLSYNDQGTTQTPNEPVPAATTQAQQARTLLREFGAQLKTDWQTFRLQVAVPSNYDFSRTAADGQWLRMGLRGLVTVPDIEFDRLGLSLSPGRWQPAAEDRSAVGDTVITPVNDGGQGYLYDSSGYLIQ